MRRFLMARKHKVEESFQLCVNYHLFRRKNPELFVRFSGLDVLIQQALRDGFPCVLPDRDRSVPTTLLITSLLAAVYFLILEGSKSKFH